MEYFFLHDLRIRVSSRGRNGPVFNYGVGKSEKIPRAHFPTSLSFRYRDFHSGESRQRSSGNLRNHKRFIRLLSDSGNGAYSRRDNDGNRTQIITEKDNSIKTPIVTEKK